jgi:hypothetical protein
MNDCLYCAENEAAIESLRARLATAEAERDKLQNKQFCAYCGWSKESSSWDDLRRHVETCEAHPLVAVIRERDTARAEVVRLREFADEVRLQMDASEPQPRSGQQVGPRAEAWQIAPSTRKYIRRLLAALDTPARDGGEVR